MWTYRQRDGDSRNGDSRNGESPEEHRLPDGATPYSVEQLGVIGSVEAATLAYPTHWGSMRQGALARAGHTFAREVSTIPAAVAVARAAGARGGVGSQRYLVLECGSLSTTASYVAPDSAGYRIDACEHEPNVGLADIPSNSVAAEGIAQVAKAAAADRQVDELLVTGELSADDHAALTAAVHAQFGASIAARHVDGPAIARRMAPDRPLETPARVAVLREPAAAWLEPTTRAVAYRRGRRVRGILAATAAIVVVVVAAGFVIRLTNTSSESPAPAPAEVQATVPVRQVGHASIVIPAGWHERPQQNAMPTRFEMAPDNGPSRRIIVAQTTLKSGAGYDEVAATLSAKIAQRDRPAQLGELERDVVFGGRPGISYRESPDENSQVRWHVIVEHDNQVSIGCQFSTGGWDTIVGDCEQVVRTLVIAP